jgi:hypothetical protein
LKTGCKVEYLDQRQMKLQDAGERCITATNENLHHLYPSPDIIKTRSRRTRHRQRDTREKSGLESLKGRDKLEDTGIDGRIILKCILRKNDLGVWIGFIWRRIGIGGYALVNTTMKLFIY